MSENPIREDAAHIYCSAETRDLIRGLKRGGETYDELLRRMVRQCSSDTESAQEEADGGV
jgi:hypothetical protein